MFLHPLPVDGEGLVGGALESMLDQEGVDLLNLTPLRLHQGLPRWTSIFGVGRGGKNVQGAKDTKRSRHAEGP
ncbi:MAG: hypothetical protein HYZ13_05235 [Acidobacteria bacterium]|nr:hypothetical protein [Acidobacteriota bacterium]